MEVVLLGTGGARGAPRADCGCVACAGLRALRTWRAPTCLLVDGTLLVGDPTHAPGAAARVGRSLVGLRHVPLPGGGDVLDVALGSGRLVVVTAAGAARAAETGGRGPAAFAVVATPHEEVPATVAALRGRGAVGAGTRVVLAGVDHDGPAPAELARRATAWGVELHPDGAVLDSAGPPPPRRILVLGGARSGKSREAERRLGSHPVVRYVATGGRRPDDAEWASRVAAHRQRRPPGWRTVETLDAAGVLTTPGPPVLLDCLALWLTGVLDAAGAWSGRPGALAEARRQVGALAAAWSSAAAPSVVVSNEVGSGVVPATASGRLFRDELGRLNMLVAEASDEVLLVVAGQVLRLR